MNIRKKDLENVFVNIIPEGITLDFSVAPNLSTAHLSTDVAYQIAKQTGEAPETIAEKIRRTLPESERVVFGVEGGWITIKILESFNSSDFTSSIEGKEFVVLLPLLEESVSTNRIYASALFQASLLKVLKADTKFIVGEEEINFSNLVSTSKSLIDSKYGKPSTDSLEKMMDRYEGKPITLWLAPDAFEPSVFRKFYSSKVAGKSSVTLKCPSSNWLYGYPDESPRMSELRDEEIFSLLLLLGGAVPSKDLDLNASKFEEKENLYWLSKTILSRLKLQSKGELPLELSVIPSLFSLLFYDGAIRGETIRLLTEYRSFLFSLLAWFGSPGRESQSHKSEEPYIISGIMNVVSDIISL